MRYAAFAVALILLLSAASAWTAAPECANPDTYGKLCGVSAFDSCYDSASFIGMAFMVVSLAIALAYMYSQFRHDPAAGVWAKDEAFNLLISILLFVGLLVFFTGSCDIALAYANANPFTASHDYISQMLASNGRDVLTSLTAKSLDDQKRATQYIYYGITPFYGTGAAGNAGWKAMSAHKEFIMDLYLPIVASLNAQEYVLQALQWLGASLLLPFAFIMRLIPPTREFGNVLIAVFFATYIVVPTMYAMSGAAFEKIVSNPAQVSGVNSFYSYGLDGTTSGVPQNAVLYKIGSTIPQAVFLPNIVLIVGITCAMAVSKALRAIAV